VTRLHVGVYDLYWATLGGGEQVDGSIAQVLAGDHDVTLLGPEPPDVERTEERLGVDLSACHFRRVTDDHEASAASADFDVFVNGTYLSRAVNRAPIGYYYVHFPEVPARRADAVRQKLCIAGVRAMRALPVTERSQRLREVAAGFDRRVVRTDFLPSYTRFLSNSVFTAGWVKRLWGLESEVLYPPVRPSVAPGEQRNLILALGRFFDPVHGHSKKQLDLVESFVAMEARGEVDGWELALVGGCGAADRDYALAVKRAAIGHRVHVHVNARGELVERMLGEASLFWHAAGYREDPVAHPDRFEHFGIALVEAMAAGAVPVVYAEAGPAEIVEDSVSGRHWREPAELQAITRSLIGDPAERERLSAGALTRARAFGGDRFAERLRDRLAADVAAAGLPGAGGPGT
jgi:glycosyltransferase involved in cell wall biosynthesis